MCGIFSVFCNEGINNIEEKRQFANKIQHRGPDNTQELLFENLLMIFHRLKINDLTDNGNQPLSLDDRYYLICNGEIYNHQSLIDKYEFVVKGHSDCEVILHMFKMFGETCFDYLSGYYACAIWDNETKTLYVSRDPFGVRQLYIGRLNSELYVCSEMKGIPNDAQIIAHDPGTVLTINKEALTTTTYGHITYKHIMRHFSEIPMEPNESNMDITKAQLNDAFTNAVKKRFMTERPFGVLLSGGLDSSMIASKVASLCPDQRIHTFSIGLKGSPDLFYARKVAEHINSIHHELIVTEQQMIDAVPKVIEQIESDDTTTVRASTPMYLLAKYIKENTNIVVIFSGEGADEVGGGYKFFHNAPSPEAFHNECIKRILELVYFDCLRCDKTTAKFGLEVRAPFLDIDFVKEYLKVPIEWRMPKDGLEKWFIREAFDQDLLPMDVLYRPKEAFSDGVSHENRSWYQIIQEHVNTQVSDDEFIQNKDTITDIESHKPQIKETYYYMKIYNKLYKNRTIPHFWMPSWHSVNDPSARVL